MENQDENQNMDNKKESPFIVGAAPPQPPQSKEEGRGDGAVKNKKMLIVIVALITGIIAVTAAIAYLVLVEKTPATPEEKVQKAFENTAAYAAAYDGSARIAIKFDSGLDTYPAGMNLDIKYDWTAPIFEMSLIIAANAEENIPEIILDLIGTEEYTYIRLRDIDLSALAGSSVDQGSIELLNSLSQNVFDRWVKVNNEQPLTEEEINSLIDKFADATGMGEQEAELIKLQMAQALKESYSLENLQISENISKALLERDFLQYQVVASATEGATEVVDGSEVIYYDVEIDTKQVGALIIDIMDTVINELKKANASNALLPSPEFANWNSSKMLAELEEDDTNLNDLVNLTIGVEKIGSKIRVIKIEEKEGAATLEVRLDYLDTLTIEEPKDAVSLVEFLEDVILPLITESLSSANYAAEDASKIATVRLLTTELELYYSETGGYPEIPISQGCINIATASTFGQYSFTNMLVEIPEDINIFYCADKVGTGNSAKSYVMGVGLSSPASLVLENDEDGEVVNGIQITGVATSCGDPFNDTVYCVSRGESKTLAKKIEKDEDREVVNGI